MTNCCDADDVCTVSLEEEYYVDFIMGKKKNEVFKVSSYTLFLFTQILLSVAISSIQKSASAPILNTIHPSI